MVSLTPAANASSCVIEWSDFAINCLGVFDVSEVSGIQQAEAKHEVINQI